MPGPGMRVEPEGLAMPDGLPRERPPRWVDPMLSLTQAPLKREAGYTRRRAAVAWVGGEPVNRPSAGRC